MEFLSKNRIMRSCISGFEDGDVIELGFSEKDILSRSDVMTLIVAQGEK